MPRKKRETRTFKLHSSFSGIVRTYKEMQMNFTLKLGSRSHRIEFPDRVEKYITSELSKRVFIAYNKILKDIKREEVSAIMDDIKEYTKELNNNYFQAAFSMPEKMEQAFLVDINSAYLKVLQNYGLISDETFAYIENLNKGERLACVGMLAKQKTIFEVEGGRVVNNDMDVSEYRFLFNFCIQEVDAAMKKVIEAVGERFIYYWVDGIYLTSLPASRKAMRVLKNLGFDSKQKILTGWRSRDRISGHEISFYEKGKDQVLRRKVFNIPRPEYYKDIKKQAFEELERELKA